MSGTFRRISQVFTPPPKRTPEREKPAPRPEPKMLVSEVRPFVDAFLSAEDMGSEGAVAAQNEILNLAKTCGLYLTAAEIQTHVSRLRRTNSEGESTHRERGFELAGELYLLRLNQQLDGLKGDARPIGPAIFKDYCSELFDCFFRCDHVRKGVGIPIWLMERLVEKAITSPEFRELYLTLAELALDVGRELSVQKAEVDSRNKQRDSRLRKKGTVVESPDVDPELEIDAQLIQYLDDVRRRFALFRQSLLEYPAVPPKAESPDAVRAQVEYLYGLLQIADKAGYLGFTAMLKERVGAALRPMHKEKARTYLNAAAKDYLRLSDHEKGLMLIKLCSRRCRKARDLYAATISEKEAAAVVQRITEMKRAFDSRLPILSQL